MTSAVVWTLILLAAAVAAAVGIARGLVRRDGAGRARSRVAGGAAALRDRVRSARPVNLETWAETLVGQAVRAARPVPGGRAVARGYQVRCGSNLYGVALPHVGALETEFVRLLGRCAADDTVRPRVRFVYDDTLHPEAYRLDTAFPEDSPLGPHAVTTTYDEPAQVAGAPSQADGGARPSPWYLRVDDGRRFDVPESGTLLVGADRDCDVVLSDQYVSARHAQVSVADGRLVLRDGASIDPADGTTARPSTNGTFLRGHPVSAATVHRSEAGVTLRLGPHASIEIGYDDPGGATQPIPASVVAFRSVTAGGDAR